MKNYLTIVLIAFCSYNFYAQTVPGYLGYRKSISYEAHLMPTYLNPTSADTSRNGKFGLAYQSHLRFDWTLSKSFNIGVEGAIFHTFLDLNSRFDEIITSPENTKINANSFAINFRWHRQHFSPLGKFFEIRFGMVNYSMEDYTYGKRNFGDTIVTNHTVEIDPAPIYYFGIGLGTNHVIKDRFILSYGINSNFLFRGFFYADILGKEPDQYYIYVNDGTAAEETRMHVEGRLFSHYLVNFKIGVGYLF